MRSDILISVCLTSIPIDRAGLMRLADLSQGLAAAYAYYEIVCTSDAGADMCQEALQSVPNLRVLEIWQGHGEYRRRVIAANEAIGDIVLITDLNEIDAIDVLDLIARADTSGKIAYGVTPGTGAVSLPVSILGKASDLSVSMRHLRSLAFPRAHLNEALRREDDELALRFPPLSREKAVAIPCPATGPHRRKLSDTGARLSLLHTLMVNSAPRVLMYTTILACCALAASIFAIVYTLAIFALHDNLEPGWLSTMMMLSSVSAFLSFSIFGACIGLQKMLDLLKPRGANEVIREKGSIDLFVSALRDLNVEVSTDAMLLDAPTAKPSKP